MLCRGYIFAIMRIDILTVLPELLESVLQDKDVLLTQGAGSIGGVAKKLMRLENE